MTDPIELERAASGTSQKSALNESDFVRKISRHQSSHFYAAIEQIRNFETREDKCKTIISNYLDQFDDDNEEDVLNLIFEYVDIPPLNRKSQFEPSYNNYKSLLLYIENSLNTPSNQNSTNNTPITTNTATPTTNTLTTLTATNTSPAASVEARVDNTNDINDINDINDTTTDIKENKDSNEPDPTHLSDAELLNLQRRIDFKWTIGENQNDLFPRINESTLNAIYFADIQSQIVRKYQIAGSVRDPDFIKRRDNTITDEYLKDWDPCLDVYFYVVCYETSESTQFKGSVCFSNLWSNMLIFGIDEDFIREACETGEWEFDVETIELSPKKSSLMGRKRFLTKKPSNRATTTTNIKENGNGNGNGNDDKSKKLVLFDNSSVHVLNDVDDDDENEMDMLADLYDICDIVAIDESDKQQDDNKDSEPVTISTSSNELFVIMEIKLSDKENNVILMARNGKKITKPLQSLITKYCVREQRDIDELKQGLESIKISKAQLDFIANNKVLDVE